MRLAEADAAVEEQRIVAASRIFGDGDGRRVRELVALARDERLERVLRVQRRRVARRDRRREIRRARLVRGGSFLRAHRHVVRADDFAIGVEQARLHGAVLMHGVRVALRLAGALLLRLADFACGHIVLRERRQIERDERDLVRAAEHAFRGVLEDRHVFSLDPVADEIIRRRELQGVVFEADGLHGREPFFAGGRRERLAHLLEDAEPRRHEVFVWHRELLLYIEGKNFFVHKGKGYPQIHPQSVDNCRLPQKNNAQGEQRALSASQGLGDEEVAVCGQLLWKIQRTCGESFPILSKAC